MREAFAQINENYTIDQVVTVGNHMEDSYANAYTTFRAIYCSVTAQPTAKVDFIHTQTGSLTTWQENYAWLSAKINEQLAKPAPGTLSFTYEKVGSNVDLHCTLTLDQALTGGTHQLWIQVTEELMPEQPPTGYHFITRAGTTPPFNVTISSPGQSQQFDWSFVIDSSWTGSIYAVAFLEKSFGDNEVLQAKQITVHGVGVGIEPSSLGKIKSTYK